MKQLTQAIFDGAPDWAESAAVDSDGEAYVFNAYAWQLSISDWGDFDTNAYDEDLPNYPEHLNTCKYMGKGYDTTNWQLSAIDREY